MGAYFQWGRNDDVTTLPVAAGPVTSAGPYFYAGTGSAYDWLSPGNDNLWGGSGSTGTGGTFVSLGSPTLMRGPCATGYHVPTQKEWCDALAAVSPTQSGGTALVCDYGQHDETVTNAFRNTLKFPLAGFRDPNNLSGTYYNQGTAGSYWTASPTYLLLGSWGGYWSPTPTGVYAGSVHFSATQVTPAHANTRSYGFSVRCLRN